ncbi:MAG TPA: ankyrin repeat domain-containing protein, partial [Terriglobia bacterium]|nr:ankyrin repeat domain-containing protein [Terriglobia bacterium]
SAILMGFLLLASLPGVAASEDLRLVAAAKERNMAALRALLNEHAAVNASQPDGATALHWAAHWDDRQAAELLIAAGANVNAKNDYGITPLFLACTNGSAAMVELLLQAGADARAVLPSGETVLMTCARAGSAEAVKKLLERGAEVNAKNHEDGQTALMWAVAQKHPEVVATLIAHGADLHARSKGGFSPLLFAARVGDVESARLLLAAGANVNEAMPNKARAPHLTSRYGEAPQGASPPAEEPQLGTTTPLLMASASGHEELAIFLLQNGADPNAVDEYGATALHYTVLKGIASMNGVSLANYVSYLFRPNMPHLAKALLEHGANPDARILKGVPVAGGRGADASGATAFLLAAAANDTHIMRLLVEHGANPRLVADDNRTAIMAGAGLGRVQDFTPQEEQAALECLKFAVSLGGDVNAVDAKNRTALHGATNLGANTLIRFLAEQGAKLDVRDIYQQTPLSIASGVHLPWTPKGEELGEVVRRETADLLLQLGATPLDTPGYFTPVEQESDAYRLNPRRTVPGVAVPD